MGDVSILYLDYFWVELYGCYEGCQKYLLDQGVNKMKKKCIVHIGMQKTGSTSIQGTLSRNLLSETFYYLDLGYESHSILISSIFIADTVISAKRKLEHMNASTKEKLIEKINLSKKPIMIISGEGIPQLSKNALVELKEFLYQYFEEITIFSYIRSPKSYIESLFQQRVKGGLSKFNLQKLYPDYRKRFEKFDLVFGKKNVIFVKFDPRNFSNRNVVMDFCKYFDIEMSVENTIRNNESLSREALSLLYIYIENNPSDKVIRNVIFENRKLVNELKSIGNTKIKFSPSLIKPILEKHKDDILWMEKRLGENLTESMNPAENDISAEEDLLSVSQETIQALKDTIGTDYFPKETTGNRQQDVTNMVSALYIKLAKDININPQERYDMKLLELVSKIKEDNADKLSTINDRKMAMIIKEALIHIKNDIETADTTVRVPVLGMFRVHMIEKEDEGVKSAQKRIIFKPMKVKED